jgi:hypothetical protein
MKINYLEDLHIPDLGAWSSEAAGDWLHPLHGPLPDHLGLLECGGQEFMAALWELPYTLAVMLEQLRDESTDPRVPMRHLDDVYSMRGWITQTYLWEITGIKIICGRHVIAPDYTDTCNPGWREKIYRTVMRESIKMCANFPGEQV